MVAERAAARADAVGTVNNSEVGPKLSLGRRAHAVMFVNAVVQARRRFRGNVGACSACLWAAAACSSPVAAKRLACLLRVGVQRVTRTDACARQPDLLHDPG
jgi:hypothetical protein